MSKLTPSTCVGALVYGPMSPLELKKSPMVVLSKIKKEISLPKDVSSMIGVSMDEGLMPLQWVDTLDIKMDADTM